MQNPPSSPYLVRPGQPFRAHHADSKPPKDAPHGKHAKKELVEEVERLAELQRILYAHDRHAVLLVFQALDAAGKDGTIRHVLSGVNPAGCQVHSFKRPSPEELDHDFLWRTVRCLPERGRIGVFNRSYYEEVLVVRVHQELLQFQQLPEDCLDLETLWNQRYQSIREHEQHLVRNGTMILKFWLHVSKDEQRKRFLSRLEEPEKNWKFSVADVEERQHWHAYMKAFEEALSATSEPWAPWYAIPADDKPFMRLTIARIVVSALEGLGLGYPAVAAADRDRFDAMRKLLEDEGD